MFKWLIKKKLLSNLISGEDFPAIILFNRCCIARKNNNTEGKWKICFRKVVQ